MLKIDSCTKQWCDWSLVIKYIVHNASQLPYDILLNEAEWPKSYVSSEERGASLGSVSMEAILKMIPTHTLREFSQALYPDNFDNKKTKRFNLTSECVERVAEGIATAVRMDVTARHSKYYIAIIGCVGDAVNTINLCISILRFTKSKDMKIEFHIFETNASKCTEGK